MAKSYWLIKTEPEEWSWKDQVKCGSKGSLWDGVRNYQARNNLKKMSYGDQSFFYHTGKEKKIVGIVEVINESFLDKSDKTKKFVSIVVKAFYPLKREVTLYEIKKNKVFKDFPLVKQSRLSVMKVDLKYWKKISKMGKV